MERKSRVKVVRCKYVANHCADQIYCFYSCLKFYVAGWGYLCIFSDSHKFSGHLALVEEGDVISFTTNDNKKVTEFVNHTLEEK